MAVAAVRCNLRGMAFSQLRRIRLYFVSSRNMSSVANRESFMNVTFSSPTARHQRRSIP